MWHQPCQRYKYTTSVDIQNTCCEKLVTHVEIHANGVSLLESGEQRCIKTIIMFFRPFRVQELCVSRGGRPGLPVLMSLTVSVDVKQH